MSTKVLTLAGDVQLGTVLWCLGGQEALTKLIDDAPLSYGILSPPLF